MNFKDKRYYIAKIKEFLGMIASAIIFALIVVMCIVLT